MNGRPEPSTGPVHRWIQVLPDAGSAARRAAEVIALRLQLTVRRTGRFNLALSGGQDAVAMYEALATMALPWRGVQIFQVDDVVARRNRTRWFTNLEAALGRTGAALFPMPAESPLGDGVASYAQAIAGSLDLVQLTLRPDASTSSDFTDDAFAGMDDGNVVVGTDRDGTARMALSHRCLSKAQEVLWLVTGAAKARALDRLCAGDPTAPATRTVCDRMRFVTDAPAAQLIAGRTSPHVHIWYRGPVARATATA